MSLGVKVWRGTGAGGVREGRAGRSVLALMVAACVMYGAGCREAGVGVRPRSLAEVPAARLAFRFEPDVDVSGAGARFEDDEKEEPLAAIKADFESRRTEEALLRTIVSPDGQKAVALYATADTPEGDFRMDLYSSAGQFLRNIMPPNLSGAFQQTVAWSPDGQRIAFIGIRDETPQPTPTPLFDPLAPAPGASPALAPDTAPTPVASATPLIAPVPVFSTEQIYVCDAYGYQITPLTSRDGLIYFAFEWSPDSQRIAALACKPDEWDARRREDKPASGRPRLIELNGSERLLADRMADAAPVWSPDGSKVAAAFETDVAIYDATGDAPTGAQIPLRDALLAASAQYDASKLSSAKSGGAQGSDKNAGAKQNATAVVTSAPPAGETPLSFNPIVRLEWTTPETLFVRTAFLRLYRNGEVVRNYPRWHTLHLSPQAAVISLRASPPSRADGARASTIAFPDAHTLVFRDARAQAG